MSTHKRKGSRKKARPYKVPILLLIAFFLISGAIASILVILPQAAGKFSLGKINFEAFKDKSVPPPRAPIIKQSKVPHSSYSLPLVAIIIDDMGYHKKIDYHLLHLSAPLSFSFLPYGPFTRKYAEVAHKLGRDVLIHIPMEAIEKDINPGPGALRTDMDPAEIIRIIGEEISLVPYAKGANNHMGSQFTTSKKMMDIVLLELKKRSLFFIDSRTTKDSIAFLEAIRLGVPALERQVFLDYQPKEHIVRQELRRLIYLAKQHGFSIAIGHPFEETYNVLKKDLPLVQKEVKIVPVSHLIALFKGD